MNYQRQAEYPCSCREQQHCIKGYSPICVQGVKPYAAAGRVEYRIGEEVINIYYDAPKKYEDGTAPLRWK